MIIKKGRIVFVFLIIILMEIGLFSKESFEAEVPKVDRIVKLPNVTNDSIKYYHVMSSQSNKSFTGIFGLLVVDMKAQLVFGEMFFNKFFSLNNLQNKQAFQKSISAEVDGDIGGGTYYKLYEYLGNETNSTLDIGNRQIKIEKMGISCEPCPTSIRYEKGNFKDIIKKLNLKDELETLIIQRGFTKDEELVVILDGNTLECGLLNGTILCSIKDGKHRCFLGTNPKDRNTKSFEVFNNGEQPNIEELNNFFGDPLSKINFAELYNFLEGNETARVIQINNRKFNVIKIRPEVEEYYLYAKDGKIINRGKGVSETRGKNFEKNVSLPKEGEYLSVLENGKEINSLTSSYQVQKCNNFLWILFGAFITFTSLIFFIMLHAKKNPIKKIIPQEISSKELSVIPEANEILETPKISPPIIQPIDKIVDEKIEKAFMFGKSLSEWFEHVESYENELIQKYPDIQKVMDEFRKNFKAKKIGSFVTELEHVRKGKEPLKDLENELVSILLMCLSPALVLMKHLHPCWRKKRRVKEYESEDHQIWYNLQRYLDSAVEIIEKEPFRIEPIKIEFLKEFQHDDEAMMNTKEVKIDEYFPEHSRESGKKLIIVGVERWGFKKEGKIIEKASVLIG